VKTLEQNKICIYKEEINFVQIQVYTMILLLTYKGYFTIKHNKA